MKEKQIETQFFKIRPETGREQTILDVFSQLKKGADLFQGMTKEPDIAGDFIRDYLDICVKKGLLKTSGPVDKRGFEIDKEYTKVLGIGFRGKQCFLTVMDFGGNVVEKESIQIDLLLKGRGKNKDISGIVREIAGQTRLKNGGLACAGIAVPEEIIEINPKSVNIFAKGIGDIFGCRSYVTTAATAAGYGDRDFDPRVKGEDILYMYSDVGTGVVLKKEMIFEADEYSDEKYGAYLRPWNQFSIVSTTKDLVSRGVGTDIVEMVKGDVDSITLDVVLKAAERKDELAEDLVRRSGLALGVRVAYLINMFNVKFVLFGGEVEKEEVCFIQYVRESMDKFLSREMLNNLEIIPGVLGEESSSIGAALLCRREIFMEV